MRDGTDRRQVSSAAAGNGSAASSVEQTWRIPQKAGTAALCAHRKSPVTMKWGWFNAGQLEPAMVAQCFIKLRHRIDCNSIAFYNNK